jgi:hypothetical protein
MWLEALERLRIRRPMYLFGFLRQQVRTLSGYRNDYAQEEWPVVPAAAEEPAFTALGAPVILGSPLPLFAYRASRRILFLESFGAPA